MTRSSKAVFDDAVALPEADRLQLASELIASVDGPPDADWEAAWTAEIDRRIAAADRSGAPAADWSDVRARILSQLGSDAILGLAQTVAGDAPAAVAAYAAAHAEMGDSLDALVDTRRSKPSDDLLTRLIEAEIDGVQLDRDELLAFFELLLLAGHETTTNLIANAVLCLAAHPEAARGAGARSGCRRGSAAVSVAGTPGFSSDA
jgi:putative addiction module component (TIGR02574 family)